MLEALSYIFQPGVLALLLLGIIVGLVFGIIPGLTGSMGVMLMMPITYAMDHITAIVFLLGIYIGGVSGGCVAAIMIGIPGTNSAVATVYDGYEMTKKGEVVRALSAAFVANALGTVPSATIALFLSRELAELAIHMGPWEFFSLGMCAIVMVSTLSKGNIAKGLLASGIGLICCTVGAAPVCGTFRFTFGNYNLYGGLSMTYVVMGIYASRIILLEYARRKPETKRQLVEVKKFKLPVEDIRSNKRTILESWFLGLWIGFLPGMGPGLSCVTAYARAQNVSKHPEQFGHGCVDGVFAPEVANNASQGGALIPMVALGIPGDAGTAYLLGALMLHGVEPGPLMFKQEPVLCNTIFLSVIVAGLLILVIETLGIRILPKILNIPYHYLYPVIVMCCFTGVFANQKTLFAMALLLFFAIIGILFVYFNLPIAPFSLGFVLGKVLETNFRRAMTYSDNGYWSFFTRPVSCILLMFALYCVVSPWIKERIKERKAAKGLL